MEALQTRVRQGAATWADVLAEAQTNPDLGQVRSLLLLAELKLKPPGTREARWRRDAVHAAGGRNKAQSAGGRNKAQSAGGRNQAQSAGGRNKAQSFASGIGVGFFVVVCATLAHVYV